MTHAELTRIGPAESVVRCVEGPALPPPGTGEIVVRIEAAGINPADILMIEGNYAVVPQTPCRLGIEGAGTVGAVGAGVDGLAVGDKVLSLARNNWCSEQLLKPQEVVKLPAGIDMLQAGMLKANPASALLMLTEYVPLQPGDWVLQDAGNSAVGLNLVSIARARGLRTVSIVRRDSAVEPVRAAGGDVVLVDGPDLAVRIREATGGADIGLAIDAVAGPIVETLGDALAEGGTVVNYGLLSGKPCQLRADQVVFKDIRLVGFWLAKVMPKLGYDRIAAMYRDLAGYVMDGVIDIPVEATYPLAEVGRALAHAKREARGGKVVLTP
ncbi:MAG: zinc-dependent alcohol dehydrogenase family protein [Thalassobaculum sp.]|uniref:zinc-dependent alcohol dehydrogenase family protein n=1 Tax=Thalassobaculum sp. TaxID=2022740 RepID=UPI0032EF47E4